ncbi:MAG: YgiQ family radical SAM protein [Anaerolineae bacterium]|nr:YgiQ family radical SAM protein [Anaerolineae bacterium]
MKDSPFLPTTPEELSARGWDTLDVILVTGDSYIDSPFIGAAVVGRVLEAAGFRVGIIAQPRLDTSADITRLGLPRLFWGVTAGSIDSMVANYTAGKKRRKSDDYTPGGENTRRPDRATIAYTNLIRRHCKDSAPIVLGGIEASLRRVAHYDYWSDTVRRSILFDAKADYLLYGMAEQSVVQLAQTLRHGSDARALRGLCYIDKRPQPDYLVLPEYEKVSADPLAFIEMFHTFYQNSDPLSAKGLCQQHGDRWLVHNPPALYPNQAEMDAAYALPYARAQHPYYEQQGAVKALETIRFSISTHRGCYGECNYCSIAVHEGRTVRWRSPDSVVSEAEAIAALPGFKGYIQDAGGPTANMYGFECRKKLARGACVDKRCLYPQVCPALRPTHNPQIDLLRRLRRVPGIKKVFVASGVRYDLILSDREAGRPYLKELISYHISGQMKVAPEHTETHVLARMGKPGQHSLLAFKKMFVELTAQAGKEQYLTYYLIAAHPGCSEEDMRRVKAFASRELRIAPEQVQVFTPLPGTYSSLMYHTGLDPFTLQPLFVERDPARRERQKQILVEKPSGESAPAQRARPSPRPGLPATRRPAAPKQPPGPRRRGGKV